MALCDTDEIGAFRWIGVGLVSTVGGRAKRRSDAVAVKPLQTTPKRSCAGAGPYCPLTRSLIRQSRQLPKEDGGRNWHPRHEMFTGAPRNVRLERPAESA